MRFLNRNKMRPPDILFDKRTDAARQEVQEFIERTSSKGGTRRVPGPDWLDERADFRKEVADLFQGLCAYCESYAPFEAGRHRGLIGRHRPQALAQDKEGKTELLAYAWLMYDWENLIWLCPDCARRKGNLFFVKGERGKPFMSVEDLRKAEGELLLDPCFHQPADHFTFEAGGKVKGNSSAGHTTIELLDLNRAELVTNRRQAIEEMSGNLEFVVAQKLEQNWSGRSTIPAHPFDVDPLHHAGAATQVILSFARSRDIEFKDVADFLEAFDQLDSKSQNSFIDDLLKEAQGGTGHETDAVSGTRVTSLDTKPQTRSRIPKIQSLPTALKPITRVEISNFKVLRDITFDLPDTVADSDQSPCMLLLGENAMGKSSVLEAMALAVIGAHEAAELDRAIKDESASPIELIHRPDPYDWSQTAEQMHVQLDFLDTEQSATLAAKAGEETFSGTDVCTKVVLGYGPRRFFTSRRTRRLRAPAYRVRSLFDPMDMIANPIHWLSGLDDQQFYAAARALREVLMLSDEDDFERDFDPETPGQIYIRQNGQLVAMKDLSVGFKSIIAMVCDIIREMLYHFDNLEFASAVVFIDEIETHLHPRWKMKIMTLMRRAFPKVQFIVTTHDPLCLRGMYDGEVFVLHRSPETDHVEKVTDLPSIKGMRSEQILTSEFFGLGSTDPETDARLVQYNRLAARIEELSGEERDELERLRRQLDDDMVIGTTMREQAYAEALKERLASREVTPTRASSPRRAELRSRFSSLFERESGA